MLHTERYDTAAEARDRPAYDAEMAKFSARHELQTTTWTARMKNRLGPLKSMNGRERLRGFLNKLGFEIPLTGSLATLPGCGERMTGTST